MSKLIQKAGFLNPKRAGRYMNYIATRDGVELLDENADSIYMRYIATRPRAEKHGEHGLFGAEDAVDLEKTLGELKAHEGNVWTIIYSLRREDAARLGYDNAASWRALLRSKQADFAEAMQIPPSQLRWYAAFHDEGEDVYKRQPPSRSEPRGRHRMRRISSRFWRLTGFAVTPKACAAFICGCCIPASG